MRVQTLALPEAGAYADRSAQRLGDRFEDEIIALGLRDAGARQGADARD